VPFGAGIFAVWQKSRGLFLLLGSERNVGGEQGDGTVTGCSIGSRACFMVGEKNFADAAVFEMVAQ
jgi:hypothetical protein